MIMRRYLFIISALVFTVGFASCNATDWPDDEDGFLNQELVIKNADGTEFKTKNKLAIGNKKSYPIGSVFVGGGVADPSKGSSHRCHFYGESFTEGPNWDKVPAMVYIGGFRHTGTEGLLRASPAGHIPGGHRAIPCGAGHSLADGQHECGQCPPA